MRRILILCLAAVVFGAACGASPSRRASTSAVEADAWSDLPVGWSELTPPPVIARPARVWTGSQLLLWSGYTYGGGTAPNEGAIYTPGSDRWEQIAPSPLQGRYGSAIVWTGEEVLIWGGWNQRTPLGDGAAYDPSDDSWRSLPESPLSPRSPLTAVWTGNEMVVWGSHDRPNPGSDGAAYDPERDEWRTIAHSPVEINLGTGIWTGSEMIVYGSQLDNDNRSDSGKNAGATYDPASDSWRLLPETGLSPQATTLAWTGARAVAWDYETQAGAYNPSTDSWDGIPALPLDSSECYPSSVALDSRVFAWFCGRAAIFDDQTSTWTDISPDDPRLQPTSDVIAPVAAGSVVLLPGIRGSDESVLWAYKPPRKSESPSTASSDQPSCEDNHRDYGYGKTPPGQWLENLLLELGAPGGHPLTGADVRDTGTALWIDIPAYEGGLTIYATMLTPGTDPNVTASRTEREIGQRHSYTLYFDDGNAWESYKAANVLWELALLASPGAGNADVTWPADTVEWLQRAVDFAERSPPRCSGPIT